jgi:uncharacterized protein YcbK (DUF882 family)
MADELTITSGRRCISYNAKLPGAVSGSYHVKGLAIDVLVPDEVYRQDLINAAQACDFHGFGYGSDYQHMDLRANPSKWDYDSSNNPIPHNDVLK